MAPKAYIKIISKIYAERQEKREGKITKEIEANGDEIGSLQGHGSGRGKGGLTTASVDCTDCKSMLRVVSSAVFVI